MYKCATTALINGLYIRGHFNKSSPGSRAEVFHLLLERYARPEHVLSTFIFLLDIVVWIHQWMLLTTVFPAFSFPDSVFWSWESLFSGFNSHACSKALVRTGVKNHLFCQFSQSSSGRGLERTAGGGKCRRQPSVWAEKHVIWLSDWYTDGKEPLVPYLMLYSKYVFSYPESLHVEKLLYVKHCSGIHESNVPLYFNNKLRVFPRLLLHQCFKAAEE